MTHFRVVIGLAAIVLSGWTLQREQNLVQGIGLAAGLLVILLAVTERRLRLRFGVLRLSAVMLAMDTALLLVVLGLNEVQPGDPASLLLVLPLIQAGIRHGVFGAVVVWASVAMTLFGQLAVTWSGAPEQAQAPIKLAMILLAVGVPAGRLAEHLANRLGSAADERSQLDHRGDVLMTVLEGAAAMSSAGDSIDSTLVRFAGELVAGDARIVAAPSQQSGAGSAVIADSVDGTGVVVEIGLGGTPPRMLEVSVGQAPDSVAIEALELLAANHRTLTGRQHVEASPIGEQLVTAPGRRSIGDLLADTVPAGGILDRPELNAILADLLVTPDRSRVGLAVISLDNLQLLNDLHGRAAGNRLIEGTTGRLVEITASPAPIVGWMGGDDFVAVFPNVDGLGGPALSGAELAATVRSALGGSVDLGSFGSTLIHAGIGGAIADGAMTGPMLMRIATEQMVADRREQNRRFLADAEVALAFDVDDMDDVDDAAERAVDETAVDDDGEVDLWFNPNLPTVRS